MRRPAIRGVGSPNQVATLASAYPKTEKTMIIAGILANICIGFKSNIKLLYMLPNMFMNYISYIDYITR